MLYFYPLIIYFSVFVIINLIKFHKIFALFFSLSVLILTLKANVVLIKNQMRPNNPKNIIRKTVQKLKTLRPNEKFRIYDYQYLNRAPSISTSLFLYFEGLIDEKNGSRLGFSTLDNLPYEKIMVVKGISEPVAIYDLSPYWNEPLSKKEDWINVSPKYVCLDILEWWKVKEFKSTFSLSSYIKGKLQLN